MKRSAHPASEPQRRSSGQAWPADDGSAPDPDDTPATFRWPVTVYYEDTDAGGIVYYANYLRFFERARTEWLRALGVSHRETAQRDGLQFVVRDLQVSYHRPARLDDRLTMHLSLVECRRASISLRQWASLEDDPTMLVEAVVRIAAIRCDNGRPTAMPSRLLSRIAE
ncbi:MAG: tol-pal system-associated acyl-CoA thioesterase [Burkholderiaceae bacterium]